MFGYNLPFRCWNIIHYTWLYFYLPSELLSRPFHCDGWQRKFSRNVDKFLQLLHGTLQIPIKTRNLIWKSLYSVWYHEARRVTYCDIRFPFQAQNMRHSEHGGCCRQKQAFTAVRVKKSCWMRRKCWLMCLLTKNRDTHTECFGCK
jgi:hypothetical protein